ncbi:hypothetical protein ACOMHN_028280 [Nucella lapillus]
MLPPVRVSADMALALRQVMRLHPSLFSPRLTQCAGCRRQVSTLLLLKRPPPLPSCLSLSPPLLLQSSPFLTSATCHLRRTGLFGMAADPPDIKPSMADQAAPPSVSAAGRKMLNPDVKLQCVTEDVES